MWILEQSTSRQGTYAFVRVGMRGQGKELLDHRQRAANKLLCLAGAAGLLETPVEKLGHTLRRKIAQRSIAPDANISRALRRRHAYELPIASKIADTTISAAFAFARLESENQ